MRQNLIHLQGSEHYHNDQETEACEPGADDVRQLHALARKYYKVCTVHFTF